MIEEKIKQHSNDGSNKIVCHYLSEKAGMSAVDKKTIQIKIQEITKGTPKYLHQKELETKRNKQILIMKEKVQQYSKIQRQQLRSIWRDNIINLEQQRDLSKYWAHFDFDMFYIACQLLDQSELKQKPCAVGSINGVLCTANYQARKYGVRSALPTFIAYKLCPELVLIEPHFEKYKKYSQIFRKILSEFDEQLESHGLDEAYIQLTDYLTGKTLTQKQQFIKAIRNRIYQLTGLTVSCGIGANKMLAKIASEQRKPNNQFILQNDGQIIKNFLNKKQLRKIPGIGPVNELYLKGLNIFTPQDILNNTDVLSICFSDLSTKFFVQTSLGLASNQHEFTQRKSIGKSQTFRSTDDYNFLRDKLKSLCTQVSIEMQELGYLTLNVVLSFQTQNYQKKDKTIRLNKYTVNQNQLFESVSKTFKEIKGKIRLLGIRATALIKEAQWKKKKIQNFMNNKKQNNINKIETISQTYQKQDRWDKEDKSERQTQKCKIIQAKTVFSQNTEKGSFLCPICQKLIPCKGNNSIFLKHFDICLIKSENKEEPKNQLKFSSEKKQRQKNSKPKKTGNLNAFFKK